MVIQMISARQYDLAEMNDSTMLSDLNKTSTVYSCAENQILGHITPRTKLMIRKFLNSGYQKWNTYLIDWVGPGRERNPE